jgi:hypothetical protein
MQANYHSGVGQRSWQAGGSEGEGMLMQEGNSYNPRRLKGCLSHPIGHDGLKE